MMPVELFRQLPETIPERPVTAEQERFEHYVGEVAEVRTRVEQIDEMIRAANEWLQNTELEASESIERGLVIGNQLVDYLGRLEQLDDSVLPAILPGMSIDQLQHSVVQAKDLVKQRIKADFERWSSLLNQKYAELRLDTIEEIENIDDIYLLVSQAWPEFRTQHEIRQLADRVYEVIEDNPAQLQDYLAIDQSLDLLGELRVSGSLDVGLEDLPRIIDSAVTSAQKERLIQLRSFIVDLWIEGRNDPAVFEQDGFPFGDVEEEMKDSLQTLESMGEEQAVLYLSMKLADAGGYKECRQDVDYFLSKLDLDRIAKRYPDHVSSEFARLLDLTRSESQTDEDLDDQVNQISLSMQIQQQIHDGLPLHAPHIFNAIGELDEHGRHSEELCRSLANSAKVPRIVRRYLVSRITSEMNGDLARVYKESVPFGGIEVAAELLSVRNQYTPEEVDRLVDEWQLIEDDPSAGSSCGKYIRERLSYLSLEEHEAYYKQALDRYPEYAAGIYRDADQPNVTEVLKRFRLGHGPHEYNLLKDRLNAAGTPYSKRASEILDKFEELSGQLNLIPEVGSPSYLVDRLGIAEEDMSLDEIEAKLTRMLGSISVVFDSTSPELNKIQDVLIQLLLNENTSIDKVQNIRSIFEHNNTPDVAKAYMVFDVMHPPATLDFKLRNEGSSPVLANAGARQRKAIIFTDLLKVHIEAGNQNLAHFIEDMLEHQHLMEVRNEDELLSMSVDEQMSLQRFLRRMQVVHGASSLEKPVTNDEPGAVMADLDALRSAYRVASTQRLTDRILDMYGRWLGYGSLEEVLQRMEGVVNEADARNKQAYLDNPDSYLIREGDLLKGFRGDDLASFVQSGPLATEFLGVNSGQDSTPLDTDFSMVLPIDGETNREKVSSSLAPTYGDVLLGVRQRGQFHFSDTEQVQGYDSHKYELFHSGIHGKQHVGVRTGLPFTEVDFLVLSDKLIANQEARDRIIFTVSQLPYYVPVVNVDGVYLYKPEDQAGWRLDYSELELMFSKDSVSGLEIIEQLSKIEYLDKQYQADAGVWEGYTLGQHTAMVIDQFDKYFDRMFVDGAEQTLPLVKHEFKLMLALHDIGKAQGVQREGTTQSQHKYTREIMLSVIDNLPTHHRSKELMVAIACQDYLGSYFTSKLGLETASGLIKNLAAEQGVAVDSLLSLLLMYYISDASAYTEDAGGQYSLDKLFVFSQNESGDLEVLLNGELESNWIRLKHACLN